ncbi:MAG: DUF3805 domain-containing protein [Leptospiraceae bacterium]|nr:DUF3805 domain-containing protein [Leptospiraceae bacterium]MCK6380063.1 DUF3805 domain-containing protein [Leptospiraceae bacterium]NUM40656.1 DUF3805 domain-containing protein [Leptospiraceae bacterium]
MSLKLEYQYYKSPYGWYSLVYPEFWETEVIEGIPAFFDPEGTGALLVSAFQNLEGEYHLQTELARFLSQHNVEYEEDSIAKFTNNEGCNILACEFISDNRFWMVYMLSKKDKLIVCSYNSDESPDNELSTILTTIISSIKVIEHE